MNMEKDIIRMVKRLSGKDHLPLGAGWDDAALVDVPQKKILVSSDMIVEGTHFLSSQKPQDIGRKAASVSLSDMAAMGAKPLYLLLSIGVPKKTLLSYVRQVFKGILHSCKPFNVKLIGGDTVGSDKLVLDTVVIGVNEKGKVLKRSGAKPGDAIFTTGFFGSSFQTGWHCRFVPRIKEMEYLQKKIRIHSAIDASDGLYTSLSLLSRESGVSFCVNCDQIPLRKKKKTFIRSLESALFDGEDFELVFTGRIKDAEKIQRKFQRKFHTPLTVIGTVKKGKGLKYFDGNKRLIKVQNREFDHFEK